MLSVSKFYRQRHAVISSFALKILPRCATGYVQLMSPLESFAAQQLTDLAEDLICHCAAALADYKRIGKIIFVPVVPVSASGKLFMFFEIPWLGPGAHKHPLTTQLGIGCFCDNASIFHSSGVVFFQNCNGESYLAFKTICESWLPHLFPVEYFCFVILGMLGDGQKPRMGGSWERSVPPTQSPVWWRRLTMTREFLTRHHYPKKCMITLWKVCWWTFPEYSPFG